MKRVINTTRKKAISLILVLALLLSVLTVGFSASAQDESVAPQYTVNADTSPAIPAFAGTRVNLQNVNVLFAGESNAVSGAEITWALAEDYGANLALSGNYINAYKKGTYKITATAGSKTATLWVVVANQTDAAWNLYEIDFDKDYTEAYSKLEYTANAPLSAAQTVYGIDGTTVLGTSKYPNNVSINNRWYYSYYSGTWKYNGTTFDYNPTESSSTYPAEIAFPSGWSSYVSSPGSNGISNLYKVGHVMPYDFSAGLQTDEALNTISKNRKGIVPFANTYLFDGLNMSEYTGEKGGKLFNTYYNDTNTKGQVRQDTKGYFVLNNEITQAFSDYEINTTLNFEYSNAQQAGYGNNGFDTGKWLYIYGRMPVDSTGKPSYSNAYASTVNSYTYDGSATSVTALTNVKMQAIALNARSAYGYVARADYSGDYSGNLNLTPWGSNPNSAEDNTFKYNKWSYLQSLGGGDSGWANNEFTNTGVALNLTVKYEGTNATLTSKDDAANTQITFSDVQVNKGAIALGLNSITVDSVSEVPLLAQWINVHTFSINLVNDITAANDGSEYPYYEDFDIYTVTQASPAIPMYVETQVDTAEFYIEIAAGKKVLGSACTFTFAENYDGISVVNGIITANKTGLYKATVTSGDNSTCLYIVVANKDAAAWNLYSIDFDKDYTEAYSKLEYIADENITSVTTTNNMVRNYYSGTWKYNGTAFDYDPTDSNSTYPSEIALPSGWSSYLSPAGYDDCFEKLYKIGHVMPYDFSAGNNTNETLISINANRKGIIPFANTYLFDGLDISEYGTGIFNKYSDANQAIRQGGKGYFVLSNEITQAFSDYTVNTNLNFNSFFGAQEGTYSGTKITGMDIGKFLYIYGRMPVDSNDMPDYKTDYSNTVNSYSAAAGVTTVTNVKMQAIALNPRKEVGYVTRIDYSGNNANTLTVVPYGSNPNSSTDSAIYTSKWSYLTGKNYAESNRTNSVIANTGVQLDLSIKYQGNTATLTSKEDTANTQIVFNDVMVNKGAVAIGVNTIGTDPGNNKTNIAQWVNVHQFSIDLVNKTEAYGGVMGIDFPNYTDLTVIYEQYDNIDAYREDDFIAPEKTGYVFGGWYSAANEDSAYTDETIKTGKTFYAKFVPERVLYTGVQLAAETTAESATTNIRFISTVDSTRYQGVTLTLNRGAGTNDMVMKMDKVYSKITGYEGETAITYEPTYYSAASKYFITHTVTGIPQSAFDTEMTVTASWTTLDGTVVSGKPTTFKISELL